MFKESCSNYVLRKTKENGFLSGFKAVQYRYKNCQSNYYLSYNKKERILITATKLVVEESKINPRILLNDK